MLHVGITHYLRAAPTPPREAPTERNHMSNIDRKRIAEDFPTLDFRQYATRARVLRVSSPKEKTA